MAESSRYFQNTSRPTKSADAHQELLASLTRINAYNPPVQTCSTGWTFHGLYSGPTSIAYLFWRLSAYYPDLTFKGQSLLEWAQAYLDLGLRVRHHPPDPNHCGVANETLAHLTLNTVMHQDQSLVHRLCSYASAINSNSTEGSDEWLYGRAGYLYFLRLARSSFKDERHASLSKLLKDTIRKTRDRIMNSPQPWKWHGKAYLGAVHGTIGIICQIVLSSPSTAPELEDLLYQVLDEQFPSGNFPSSLPPGSDKLVQFCHGGPGFVISLNSLRPHYPGLEAKINRAVSMARQDIWKRGLLVKEPCLCHGIPSNALALESQDEFEHFLAYMASDQLETNGWLYDAGRSDSFVGLYTGEAGRAWAWAVADKGLPRTCIGFNDI